MADRSDEQRLREKFWKELDDSPFIMLGLQGVDEAMTRPMTAQVDRVEGTGEEDSRRIYFFASRQEELVRGLGESHKAVAAFASRGHGLFASIHGALSLSDDRAVIDRLWSPVIASWFKDGKDDPDLVLIRFDTTSADIWEATPGASLKAAAVKMLFGADPGEEQRDQHRAEVAL